jgi:hypothetical protein
MSLSYLETSLDRIDAAARDDVIEICINPDGTCWGEFQGDHFMRALDQRLTAVQVRDLGNQIASSANTTMSKDRPIVSVCSAAIWAVNASMASAAAVLSWTIASGALRNSSIPRHFGRRGSSCARPGSGGAQCRRQDVCC